MTAKFKISSHKNGENLHLKLFGEFDGSAAMTLINLLKKCAKRYNRVIVHTASLSQMNFFGQEVFRNNFNELNEVHCRLMFTGEYANRISPEKEELSISA